jgi:hypothetical protein
MRWCVQPQRMLGNVVSSWLVMCLAKTWTGRAFTKRKKGGGKVLLGN